MVISMTPSIEKLISEQKQKELAEKHLRVLEFIKQQKQHWRRLKKGNVPEESIIKGWIESCDFATQDLVDLYREFIKVLFGN